jgi:hypothetical protein
VRYEISTVLTYLIEVSSDSKLCIGYVKLLATRCETSEDKNSITSIIKFNFHFISGCFKFLRLQNNFQGADKSLARPGRKQATTTKL